MADDGKVFRVCLRMNDGTVHHVTDADKTLDEAMNYMQDMTFDTYNGLYIPVKDEYPHAVAPGAIAEMWVERPPTAEEIDEIFKRMTHD